MANGMPRDPRSAEGSAPTVTINRILTLIVNSPPMVHATLGIRAPPPKLEGVDCQDHMDHRKEARLATNR